jgi:beta-glucosidase
MSKISRRTLARLIGGAAAATSLPTIGLAATAAKPSKPQHHALDRNFPTSFLWGSATAAYQVEGAVHAGGRGPSIWDTFSHTPGKVFDNENGDVADDFYHRYKGDIQTMKEIGLKGFRFSIAWTRIFPTGTGAPNMQGLDFYHRLVDALLEADIQPFCTLYHWDLPQALQDKGGWENRDTAEAFAHYAGYMAGQLFPKVKHFMTMNEMRTFVELGYREGTHAPGLKLDAKRVAQLTHNVVLGHGMAVRAIRAQTKPGVKIGLATNVTAATPVYESPEHIAAARKAMREENAMYITVIEEGRYTEQYLKRLGHNAPKFNAEEMKIISSPLDFVGINVYQPAFVRADDSEPGYAMVPVPESYPHMYSPWLKVGPDCIYWAPKLIHELWNVHDLYITENGASAIDTVEPDGHIYDTGRIMFLRNYLTQLQRAIADGVPVRGYFLWSLLDNFEWADGYSKRFGIVYVDYKNQKRTKKLSAAFYKQVIETNKVC